MADKSNIVLIGMPGSGKSTVGVLLAKASGKGFVDTDLLIQSSTGCTLQQIVNTRGYEALRDEEERVLSSLAVSDHVIATGGSAVYSHRAMEHLGKDGVIVFLDVSLASIRQRIGDYSLRGISKRPDQTLDELFGERLALYQQYADLTVDGNGRTQQQVCDAILARLSQVQ
ncbi:shikimate kinase [Halospina denitrificans]|uniref:Shikimate kinase n=1 Tax=Halospina denitrificans TaxID=332522 RepID=A0A4R7JYC7_9GAMM|nr:shikimate kinase [Halospina denitrificans]TDT43512.1 shikimate kinase [Halospina denitrificans]